MIFKQLPTMISDLNKLGIALKSLDAMKIGTVGVNVANIEAYRTALKGLSVEQSVFALASKGATEEQIRQILVTNQATASEVEAAMAKAGLTTATKALTQAEMVEMATKNGVAKAEAEALLSKIGITATEEGQVVVKKQVTLAMLEQAVASGTLTKAEASQIATMLGLNAVEIANIGITNVLTASFTKLWAVITAHPIGAILTAIGAVAVGTIAYINKVNKDAEKALVKAHENAEKALEDTKTSLSDDKSELQSINSELEQTKDKIREISSIGVPTLTEQNELDKLSTANAQLEIQKSLLENNIKLKQKSAALDAKELLGTQVEMEYSSILDNSSITSSTESYSYADHAKYQASNLKNAYNIYMKALEEGNVRRQELAQELIDASAGNTAELTSKLLEIVESFKYDDGTIIDGYEDIYNEYMGMIYNLQSLTNPDAFLDIAKSITVGTGVDYEKAISEAYALAYEGNFDVDNLNQDFVKALADAGIDESTIDYIFSLKQKEYQLLVDKINNKYKVSEVPDKIKQDYWDANGNIHSEYVDVDEETKNRIEEINTINQSLNDYAKENPVEFQLVTSYDEGFTLLDKYIEEEKNKAEKNTDYVGDYITNAIARIYNEAKVQGSTSNNETDISFLDIESKVQSLSKGLDQLDSIYADILDGEDFDWSSILNNDGFAEAFGNMTNVTDEYKTAYDDFIKTISNSPNDINACQNAFNNLATAYIQNSGILDELTEETKDATISMLEMMGVANADILVQNALAGARAQAVWESQNLANATSSEIIALVNEEEATNNTGEAFGTYLVQKMLAEAAIDTSGDISALANVVASLGLATSAWQRYYAAKQRMAQISADPNYVGFEEDGSIVSKETVLAQYSKIAEDSLAEYAKELENNAQKANYGGGNKSNKNSGSSKSGSSSDSKAKELKEEFNWLQRLDEYYQKQHDIQSKIAEDETVSYSERIVALKEMTNLDKERMGSATKTASEYLNKWNDIKKQLDPKYIAKIMYGDISDEEITALEDSDLADQIELIKLGIDYYDKWQDAEEKKLKLQEECTDHLREELELQQELIQAQQEMLQSEMDIVQSKIDYIEASGGVVTSGYYEEQIRLSKQISDSYEDQIDNLRKQQEMVKDESAEYYSLESQINDCEKAIIECKTQQAKWNETIKRLPVERLQKYINMLQNIKTDLQNFLDEQSTLGINPTAEQLQELIDLSSEEITKLSEQQKHLSDLLNEYEYGSEKFNDVSNEIQDIDDQISSLIQNQREWNSELLNIPITALEKVNDNLSSYSDILGDTLSQYDDVHGTVIDLLDDEVDKINDIIDATEKEYDAKIEPLQDELDLLKKKNEARQMELDLEQAAYDLDRAMNQKTNQVVRDGELVYEADQDAIREANQNKQDALYNKAVYDLEQQISALEDERDALLEGYNDQIESLETIKNYWEDIITDIERASGILKANEMLGSDWQSVVLAGGAGNEQLADYFKGLYEGVYNQKDQVDEQIASNERIVEMMNEFVERFQSGALTYEQALSGINQLSSTLSEGYTAMEQLNGMMNLDGISDLSGIATSADAKITESVDLLRDYLGIANTNYESINKIAMDWDEMKQNIAEQLETLKKLAEELAKKKETVVVFRSDSYSSRDDDGDYSSGSSGYHETYVAAGPGFTEQGMKDAIDRGDRIVFEGDAAGGYSESEVKEMYRDYVGSLEKRHRGAELGAVESGSDIQKDNLFQKVATEVLEPDEKPVLVKASEWIITPEQRDILLKNLGLTNPTPLADTVHSMQRDIQQNLPLKTNTERSVNVNFDGDIVLHDVQNPDGLAKALKTQFAPIVRQELSKIK